MIALLSFAMIPLGSDKVKKVKYFAVSAFFPAFASIWSTYISAGIPAPKAMLYFVSEKMQDARKQIPPINKCRHNRAAFSFRSSESTSSLGKFASAITISSPVVYRTSSRIPLIRTKETMKKSL